MGDTSTPGRLKFGKARFVLEASDIDFAQNSGLLKKDVPVDMADSSSLNYGRVYNKRKNIADTKFPSQQAEAAWKTFAKKRGFQLYVKTQSVQANNSGNAKYICKKLNGMQSFDSEPSVEELWCPFFVNGSGKNGKWKVTQANFSHNHLKHVGTTKTPPCEGSLPAPPKALRSTTQRVSDMIALVETDMLSSYNYSVSTMSGTAVKNFLTGKGYDTSLTTVYGIKRKIDDKLHSILLESYRKNCVLIWRSWQTKTQVQIGNLNK
ncbi:hypothetical protein L917_12568 [Phytophthora nicotianae]|uniref:Uncharacterized protein n=3 Tax=Phytophthora nicotianae TaxID=4792 RepID=V9EQY2_PHYNI|nr:hypothetical protein F443_13118 [Phytophthora nicotianae P1569]ETL88348.1 hypothetical protein L917_12568 [Phytophthora nicotianae]ETM41598.1 hypothetical protein L914_12638 [Phytophthora nicotianae]ETO70295.1 hypothetical protein F444_13208 [Phytophthora nicotianae P1976]